jgi:rare lipoprotein A
MLKYFLSAMIVLSVVACSSSPSHKAGASTAQQGYTATGKASYYSPKLHGRSTASGEPYNKGKLTAAHKKLPFGARVEVTNLSNGKTVVVRINDRGPFVKGRIIDLSGAAFKRIASLKAGVVDVKIRVLN